MVEALVCCLCKERSDRRRRLHTTANKHIIFTILELESLGKIQPVLFFLQRCYSVKKEDEVKVKVKQAGVDRGLEELQHGKLLFLLTVNIIDVTLIILTYHFYFTIGVL